MYRIPPRSHQSRPGCATAKNYFTERATDAEAAQYFAELHPAIWRIDCALKYRPPTVMARADKAID